MRREDKFGCYRYPIPKTKKVPEREAIRNGKGNSILSNINSSKALSSILKHSIELCSKITDDRLRQ
jgi:hypothetical protein